MKNSLKDLRINRHSTQIELAEIADVSVKSYRKYENGDSIPPVDSALRIAAYYGLAVEDIFSIKKSVADK